MPKYVKKKTVVDQNGVSEILITIQPRLGHFTAPRATSGPFTAPAGVRTNMN